MKNGGPAFPEVRTEYNLNVQEREVTSFGGMSLRDYIAAKAMQGDWSTQNPETGEWPNDAKDVSLFNRAQLYYRMADAMLKARE